LSGDWKYAPIIQWKDLAKNISWGVIFLFGAGLAIAAAFTVCI
jgi:di/tricarboxylate transporter